MKDEESGFLLYEVIKVAEAGFIIWGSAMKSFVFYYIYECYERLKRVSYDYMRL